MFLLIFTPTIFLDAFGEEPILISRSSGLDEIVFDGKWTTTYEWKKSSYNNLLFEDKFEIHLRTAHENDFLYVQVNAHDDTTINYNSDRAIICFDTKNDKTDIPQEDDYCFSAALGSNNFHTLQGGSISAVNGHFKKIPNHEDYIAIGTESDKNDRYSRIPHASYEFKIPLDVLGRSDNYGFYLSVFDAQSQNNYSWPYNIEKKSILSIPSTSQWGDLISPDKSLPEFSFSLLFIITIPLLFVITMITKPHLFKNNIYKQ